MDWLTKWLTMVLLLFIFLMVVFPEKPGRLVAKAVKGYIAEMSK